MAVNDVLRLTLNYKNNEEVLSSTLHYKETEPVDRSIGAEQLAKAFAAVIQTTGLDLVQPTSWVLHSVLVTYPQVEFANGWEEVFIYKGTNNANSLPELNFVAVELRGLDAGGLTVKSTLQWSGIAESNAEKTRLTPAFKNALEAVFEGFLFTIDGPGPGAWELVVPTQPGLPGDKTFDPRTVTSATANVLIAARIDRKLDTPNTGRKRDENGAPAAASKKVDRSRAARQERRKKALELKEKGRQPQSKRNRQKPTSGDQAGQPAE